MKKLLFFTFYILHFTFYIQAQLVNTSQSPYAKLASVSLGDVRFTQGFWAERFEVVKQTMSPELVKTYLDAEVSHSFENFRIAAGLADGKHSGPVFHDGDLYKTLEGVASLYAVTKDKSLYKLMDSVIAVIAAAQRADGYLHTPVIISDNNNRQEIAGQARNDRNSERLNFEAYNFGHLMTAACVHFRATGKRNFLDVAIKATDFLEHFYQNATPQTARNSICPSHYMGIIEMYRTTRDKRYLALAQKLIDFRGHTADGTDDNQDRIPFRRQTRAMGHAVRANYLYAGVADLYAETGDTSLLRPLNLIWDNLTQTKMYITGACGALYDGVSPDGTLYTPPDIQKIHQAYGRDYQLPNKTAHNETCANIGNLLWNWRMFLVTGEARYMDIVELTLYNSILSGASLDGHDFCYTNPLAVNEKFPYKLRWAGGREPYIALSNCCPPNTTRTLAEVQNYAYSLSDDGVYVNLYSGNTLKSKTKRGEKIEITQATDYPYDEKIVLEIKEIPKKNFTVYLRIPQWCENAEIYIDENRTPLAEQVAYSGKAGTYFKITDKLQKGDKIVLTLPLETKLMVSNPLVEETRNQVAVKRGAIVYCLESADLPDENIFDVTIPADIKFVPKSEKINNTTITVLEGKANIYTNKSDENSLYQEVSIFKKEIPIRLIPYFAWGNRGYKDMTVWMNLGR
ncbi:MAG: glycoside hydrolase family 127 protein [Paludibacter sp.]|jgi:DUF1680 family protein|nr:glycoside hydrolase family 127 protein [Paludibacter sp.]